MEIQIGDQGGDYEIQSFVIRVMQIPYATEDEAKAYPHFQAQLKCKGRKPPKQLQYTLAYFDAGGDFLGFDEHTTYDGSDSSLLRVSIPISVPEQAVRATLDIKKVNNIDGLGCAAILMLFIGLVVGLVVGYGIFSP